MDHECNYLDTSKSLSHFTSNFFQVLSSEQQDTNNLASSSLSVYIILSLLIHGSDGKTKEELKSALNLNDLDNIQKELKSLLTQLNDVKNAELELANGMYVDSQFELQKDFRIKSQNHFQTSIEKMNVQHSDVVAQQINEWIQNRTKNKISDIISSDDIDEDTKVILINALYFKSDWLNPFQSEFTELRTFYNIDDTQIEVPTMQKKFNVLHGYSENLKSSLIKIKYLSAALEMIIILPDEKHGLYELENNFNWNEILKTNSHSKQIELSLPKFKVEATTKLKPILTKLGIPTMFTSSADFSLMSEKPLFVDEMLQKVFVEVDEKGSEAAAATVVKIRSRRMVLDTEVFTVDHSFMFIIHHIPSSIPLFIGSIRKLGVNYKDEL